MKIQSFSLLMFGLSFMVQAQSSFLEPVDEVRWRCYYDFTFLFDSTGQFPAGEDLTLLLIGDNVSSFACYGNHYLDSIHATNRGGDGRVLRALSSQRPRFYYQWKILKDTRSRSITTTDYIFPQTYRYHESLDLFDWDLSGEADTIKGYVVQKATTHYGGRNWVAWFAPDIPVSDGPYKFRGLPGLILKVHDSRGHYVFEIRSIARVSSGLEHIVHSEGRSIVTISREEFLQARDRYWQEPELSRLFSGMVQVEGGANERAVESRLRRRNNFIEFLIE